MNRLLLRYSRSLKDGGRVTGSITVIDWLEQPVRVCVEFKQTEFVEMMTNFARLASENPTLPCFFQRIDKPGFPVTEWAPAHVEQMRTDPAQAVKELCEIKTVTYDMRVKKEE